MRPEKKSHTDFPEVDQLRQELHRVEHRSQYAAMLKSTVSMLLTAAAAAVLAATLWLPVLQITGNSMAPTLQHGDVVICQKTRAVEPGDLMGFYVGNKLLVKRCVAGPGQTVDVDEDGNLLLDGEISGQLPGQWETERPCTVPEEHVFCLGDNRAVSVDSRHREVGCVNWEQILGKPVFRVWPLNRIGLLQSEGGG